jgi:hypothetical protein
MEAACVLSKAKLMRTAAWVVHVHMHMSHSQQLLCTLPNTLWYRIPHLALCSSLVMFG